MREIDVKDISHAVELLCMDANYYLGEDILLPLEAGLEKEESDTGRMCLPSFVRMLQLPGKTGRLSVRIQAWRLCSPMSGRTSI